MASDIEDELADLRKAALATLKPKAQPISSISNVGRAQEQQNAPWLEFPTNDNNGPEHQYQPEPLPELNMLQPPMHTPGSLQMMRPSFQQPGPPQLMRPSFQQPNHSGPPQFMRPPFPQPNHSGPPQMMRLPFQQPNHSGPPQMMRPQFQQPDLPGPTQMMRPLNQQPIHPGPPQMSRPPFQQPNFRGMPHGYNYMNQDEKLFQPRGFPMDRRPFNRAQHRSFGDRGRPMRDRGRYPRRGYAPDNGRSFFPGGRGQAPGQNVNQFVPLDMENAGGNLIVINPQPKDIDVNQDSVTDTVNNNNNVSHSTTNHQTPSKPKLVLPQDKYHTSTSASAAVSDKTSAEPTPSKPRDKFSRFDDSDSEEEDDWIDSLIADDPLKNILEEDSEVSTLVEQQESPGKEAEDATCGAYEVEIRKLELSDNEEDDTEPMKLDVAVAGSSSIDSDNESLDLDALAEEKDLFSDVLDKNITSGVEVLLSEGTTDKVEVSESRLGKHDEVKDKGKPDSSASSSSSASSTSSSSSSSSSSSESSSEDENDDKAEEDVQNELGKESLKKSPNSVHSTHSSAGGKLQGLSPKENILSVTPEKRLSPPNLISGPTQTTKLSPEKRPYSPNRSYTPTRRSSSPQRQNSHSVQKSWSPRRSRSRTPSWRRSKSPRRLSPSNHSPRLSTFNEKPLSPKRSFSPRRLSPFHKSPSLRRRSISPRWRSISPRRRSISPKRRSISPRRRSISPRRRSISPRRRSISPRRRSISPRRRSMSPKRRSISPRRRSISPRKIISPRRRSISPHKAFSPSISTRKTLSPRRRSVSPRKILSPRRSSRSPLKTFLHRQRLSSPSKTRRSLSPMKNSTSLLRSTSPYKPISPRYGSRSPHKNLSPRSKSPTPRKIISPIRKSPSPRKIISPRRRSPSPRKITSPIRRSLSPHKIISPRRRSPSPHKIILPRRRSPSPRKITLPRRRSPSPSRPLLGSWSSASLQRPCSSKRISVSPRRQYYPRRSVSPTRSSLVSRKRSRSPVKQVSPHRTSSPHKHSGYSHTRDASRDRPRLGDKDYRASWNRNRDKYFTSSSSSIDRGRRDRVDHVSSYHQVGFRDRQDRKNTELSAVTKDKHGDERRSPPQTEKSLLVKNIKVEDPPMPQIDLDKLTPEERAKIEARRKKFSTSEVKIDPAKKVSLKSIKERKKKSKRPQQEAPSESAPSIHIKVRNKLESDKKETNKRERKQSPIREEADSSSDEDHQQYAALEEDSNDSETERHWKQEARQTQSAYNLNIPGKSNRLPASLDSVSMNDTSSSFRHDRDRKGNRHGSYSSRERNFYDNHRKSLHQSRPRPHQTDKLLSGNVNSSGAAGQSKLRSTLVVTKPFEPDIPLEKLRIELKVPSREKNKFKKSKAKPDFSQKYSVPAKRQLEMEADLKVAEEDVVPAKKAKKKKKNKKKEKEEQPKLLEQSPETAESAQDSEVEPVSAPRLSVLERLGKKVPFEPPKEKKKKKKKKSHADEETPTELDAKIQKIKEQNAAIARRQQEIELDKKKYG